QRLQDGPQLLEAVRPAGQGETIFVPTAVRVPEDHHAAGRVQHLQRPPQQEVGRHLANVAGLHPFSLTRGPRAGKAAPLRVLSSPRTLELPQAVESGAPLAVDRRGRRLVIVGAISMVFLLMIAYIVGGAAAAGGPVGRADAALRATFDHQNRVVASLSEDPFKNLDFKS